MFKMHIGTTNWYLKCCLDQTSSRIPPGVSRQAQRAIHQLSLNWLSSTASYQALIGQTESPTCSHYGSGDETAEHLLLLCPKWAAGRQRYFGDSIDITDVFQNYESLVEFLISSGHLSPHIGSAWRARHDNNNNKTHIAWNMKCSIVCHVENECFMANCLCLLLPPPTSDVSRHWWNQWIQRLLY